MAGIEFREGLQARRSGHPASRCPYKFPSPSAAMWFDGWRSGQSSFRVRARRFFDIMADRALNSLQSLGRR